MRNCVCYFLLPTKYRFTIHTFQEVSSERGGAFEFNNNSSLTHCVDDRANCTLLLLLDLNSMSG